MISLRGRAAHTQGLLIKCLMPVSLTAILVSGVLAQSPVVPKSQLGGVSQLIAGTRIELEYRRPVARGRELFGSLVPWGRVWSPSADTATRVTLSGPIEVNGSALAAGSYSLWAIPDSASWTIIFSRVATVFHMRYPQGQDVLRVQAVPRHTDHVESLTFVFPMVDADSAVLELRWGTTAVPLRIRRP